jgi:phenylpropionate dioxygenase-like ring-hydroxylating dioxygenase large terminal subunit
MQQTIATSSVIDYDALIKEDRVHGDVYTSSAIFEEEMSNIFHRGWVYVGHESEVPKPGDFQRRQIGRQPIIMVRDEKGLVKLFVNRCSHRANTICEDESGNAKFFRCAYHGWTYKTNGELIGVPYQSGYDDSFRMEDFALRKIPRVSTYRGFVFGSLSSTGISLDEHLGKAKQEIDFFVDLSPEGEIDVSAGVQKYRYSGNWKLQMENAVDGYHVNFVHKSFIDLTEKRTGENMMREAFSGNSTALVRDLGGGHSILDARYFRQSTPASSAVTAEVTASAQQYHDALRMAMPSPTTETEYTEAMAKNYGRERAREIINANGTHLGLFPSLMLVNVHIRVIQPISVDETHVFYYPAFLKGVPTEMNIARLRGHERIMGPAGGNAPDDIEMFERGQVGVMAQVDPWIPLLRGKHRERYDPDGTRISQMTDELPQRVFWHQWKKVMLQS